MAMQVCVKLIPAIPLLQQAFFRGIVSFFICLAYFYRHKISLRAQGNVKWLIFRGCFGSLALLTFFYSVKHLPLATAATLQYLSPLFTVLIATFFVNEPPNLQQWIALIIAFIGVLLLGSRFGESHPILYQDIAIGVGSAFFASIAYNSIRRIGSREHPMIIIFYFPVVLLLFVTIPTWIFWVKPTLIEWLLLILVGIFTHFGQVFMTYAYQKEKAANVVSINYLGSVYAAILGIFLFNEIPNATSIAGMAIIILAAIWGIKKSAKKK